MTTSIDKFISRLNQDVQGAPIEMMRQALVDAAVEFCERTRLWNEIQDAQLLVNANADYELDLPSKARLLSVEEVWCGIRELKPITMHALQTVMPDWQTRTAPEPLYYNAAFDMDTFRVYPTPADVIGAKLRIKGSFQPSDDADSLPDFLWNRYRSGIISGAKATLMAKPAVVWANPALSGVHRAMFRDAIADGIIQRMTDSVTNSQTVSARRFGTF